MKTKIYLIGNNIIISDVTKEKIINRKVKIDEELYSQMKKNSYKPKKSNSSVKLVKKDFVKYVIENNFIKL